MEAETGPGLLRGIAGSEDNLLAFFVNADAVIRHVEQKVVVIDPGAVRALADPQRLRTLPTAKAIAAGPQ